MAVLAPTSNECLRVRGPDGVQEEHRRFILVRSEKCLRPVGEASPVLSCTEVLIVGVTSGCERGRNSQVSRCEWRVWVCVTLLVPSQGPGELYIRVLLCVVMVVVLFFLSPGMIPACSFYSLKEVQGYKILARGVTLAGEGAQRPREGLIRWRRGLHCGGMTSVLLALLLRVQARAPLLREWFLSFGVVATRSVIPGPAAGVACSSL
jgi:hypothetical protein